MTGPGTNTYLLGDAASGIAVIDPGPAIESHVAAIVESAGGRIEWILCTHTHVDHSPGAAPRRIRSEATCRSARLLSFVIAGKVRSHTVGTLPSSYALN